MRIKTKPPQAIIACTESELKDFAGVLVFESADAVAKVLKKALQKSDAQTLAHKYITESPGGWFSISQNLKIDVESSYPLRLADAQALGIESVFILDVKNNRLVEIDLQTFSNSKGDKMETETEAETENEVETEPETEIFYTIEAGALLNVLRSVKKFASREIWTQIHIFLQDKNIYILFADAENHGTFGFFELKTKKAKDAIGEAGFVVDIKEFIKVIKSFSKKELVTLSEKNEKLKVNHVLLCESQKDAPGFLPGAFPSENLLLSRNDFLNIYKTLHLSVDNDEYGRPFKKGIFCFKTNKTSEWTATDGVSLSVRGLAVEIPDKFNAKGFRLGFFAKITQILKKYKSAKTVKLALHKEKNNHQGKTLAEIQFDEGYFFLEMNWLEAEYPNYHETITKYIGQQWFSLKKADLQRIVKLVKPELDANERVTFCLSKSKISVEGFVIDTKESFDVDSNFEKPRKIRICDENLMRLLNFAELIDDDMLTIYYFYKKAQEHTTSFSTFYCATPSERLLFTVDTIITDEKED